MSQTYPHLFSPIEIRGVEIRNRIFSTGHDTNMAEDGLPGDTLIAYQRARARGGAGLVIIQVAAVHPTAFYTGMMLDATRDDCIAPYRRLADAVHEHGCKVFGQIFHPGREIFHTADGTEPVAYAPSATPNQRYQVMPRPMARDMITEIVDSFATTAARFAEAGLDGVEIVASHGYLPVQFINPRVNRRDDEYGGSFENRMRFLDEVCAAVRAKAGGDLVVGMRISGDELDPDGLTSDEIVAACAALDAAGALDYVNVIAGTSASTVGAYHIVPPMLVDTGYVAPMSATIKAAVSTPVFVAGRINQPQIAEQILAAGQADMCGMTRAMIADPEMPNKARAGHGDDIRACIACNQACIGRMQAGYTISCIQHPETGRELLYGDLEPAERPKTVMVVGGGPGGMKAASVAARRGHHVTLYEKSTRLGGQVLLAQLLPGRAEFGGLATNFERELALAGVDVVTGTEVTPELIAQQAPDALVVATGARPYRPAIEGAADAHVVDAWQVIRGEANVGNSVLIADWRCDWIGVGVAEKLARDGCRVRLCSNGPVAGHRLQNYMRDHANGVLRSLGVELIPYAGLHGVDADSAYLRHLSSGEAIVCDEVDTVVLALGHEPVDGLGDSLGDFDGEVFIIGDCRAARTAEEAVLEGLKAGAAI
jgi:2,4-dienoyl-CoA reductase-like NADH-dependent reductase (Old Yellow Enzyme family)